MFIEEVRFTSIIFLLRDWILSWFFNIIGISIVNVYKTHMFRLSCTLGVGLSRLVWLSSHYVFNSIFHFWEVFSPPIKLLYPNQVKGVNYQIWLDFYIQRSICGQGWRQIDFNKPWSIDRLTYISYLRSLSMRMS
jgi:hypothetical protein